MGPRTWSISEKDVEREDPSEVERLGKKALNEDLDKIMTWMTEDLRARLKRKREHDVVFKKRSTRNRKNKVEGSKGKIGRSQGLISSTMWLYKLVTRLTDTTYVLVLM